MTKKGKIGNKVIYWFLKVYFKLVWAIFKKSFLNVKYLFTAKGFNKLWFFSIVPIFFVVKYISFDFFQHEALQLVSFFLMLNYIVLEVPLKLMQGNGHSILNIFDIDKIKSFFKTTPEDELLKEWNRKNGDKLYSLEKSIFDIFNLNKLKIEGGTEEDTRYIKKTGPIFIHNAEKSEIEIKYILPNGLPFTKVNTEHIRQSIKQVFQKYFPKTEEIDFFVRGDVFVIRNFGEKETIDFSENFNFPDIFGKEYVKQRHKNALDFSIGVNENGVEQVYNLRELPHLLVAGESGGGKSVALTNILVSLMKNRMEGHPIDFVIIDPKEVEFGIYEKLHGFVVETQIEKSLNILKSLIDEMNRRYSILKEMGIKKIEHYHNKGGEDMNYIVAIIDEFGDIMVGTDKESKENGKQIEAYITKLVQKARAVGIHCILATQNPIGEVITSNIKANTSGRLGLRTSDTTKSRTIIDSDELASIKSKGEAYMKTGNGLEHIKIFYIDEEKDLPRFIILYEALFGKNKGIKTIYHTNKSDKYDILFSKIIEENTFKIKWYSEINGFTQNEIKEISRKLQEKKILEKLPNNTLKLKDDKLLNEELKIYLKND